MFHRWVTITAAAVALLAVACAAPRVPRVEPLPPGQGGVWVYLKPPSDDAGRLDFDFTAISAVAADGELLALDLRSTRFRGDGQGGERLLATGALPPGQYRGLALGVVGATLDGPGGPTELRLPDETTRVDVPFVIPRRRAVVLSMGLRYRESVGAGFEFLPSFAAASPVQPAAGLIGLVSDRGSHSVILFDKISGQVFGVVPTGRAPGGIALDQIRTTAYVAISGDDAIAIIDLLQGAVVERLQLGSGDAPEELVLSRDRRMLLTANTGSGTVSFIDAGGRAEIDRVTVGNGPGSLLVDPLRERAYVFNTLSDTISVLDLTRRATVATIGTEAQPLRGAFNRAGDQLYVIHRASPYLTVIDPATLEIPTRVYIGTGATALTVDTRSDRILLARIGSGTIDVYDPSSLLAVDFIPVAGNVIHMALDADNYDLHALVPRQRGVSIVRLANQRERAAVDIGAGPFRVALMGER